MEINSAVLNAISMCQWMVAFMVFAWSSQTAVGSFEATTVYQWVSLDYDWESPTVKQQYIDSGKFVVENNIITGIKIYGAEVFVTVPRWRHGVPSTLNRVVIKNGQALLQPYPSWSQQSLGDCRALQFVQSMEVDPNTGFMWIIDNGRVDFLDTTPARSLCPPKLVIFDIQQNTEVHRYTFPPSVVNSTTCYLNDIVLDYVDGQARFAYIPDPNRTDPKLYVYDYEGDRSYVFQDPSMYATLPGSGGYTGINGIAMAARFDFLYYSPVDSHEFFQVPTAVLRDSNADFGQHVRRVGTRSTRSGGLTYGQQNLYYGVLDSSGVNRWEAARDARETGYSNVVITTQQPVVRNNVTMVWADTLAWDDNGHLWFTVNNLPKFMARTMDFSGSSGANMYVWKVLVNETSYLTGASVTTAQPTSQAIVG